MTAKEYLLTIEKLDKRERVLRERIEETETALTSITMDLSRDRVQGGKGGNNLVLLERLDDLTEQLAETRLQLLVKKARATLQVQGLSKKEYIHILTERYLKGRRLPEIAEDPETKYCNVHIYRLHGEALNEFAELYGPFVDDVI